MRVGRNDPCHCGSGLKFKKCHGAVIALHAEKRECGTCTACCDGWAIGTIYGHEMKPGVLAWISPWVCFADSVGSSLP